MKLLTGLLLPAAEVGLAWFWLAGGHEVAGRLLTFYWWLIVVALFSLSMLLIGARLLIDRDFPIPPARSRVSRIWGGLLFFARVIAQLAIGCMSLAVLSLAAWLFCKFALLLVTDEKKVAGA